MLLKNDSYKMPKCEHFCYFAQPSIMMPDEADQSNEQGANSELQIRLDIKAIQMDITSKYVPPHVNIFY